MSKDFDPYFHWLKIPPSEQPPNHYRLLNTARFESDPGVIEAAVARLVARLQSLSAGDNVEHSQRILNDVAKARLCLSNQKLKAEYDESLRNQLFEKPSAKKSPIKPTMPTKSAPPALPQKSKNAAAVKQNGNKTSSTEAKSKKAEPKSATGLLIGYGVAIVLVAGGALFFLFQQHSSGNQNSDVAAGNKTKVVASNAVNDQPTKTIADTPSAPSSENNELASTESADPATTETSDAAEGNQDSAEKATNPAPVDMKPTQPDPPKPTTTPTPVPTTPTPEPGSNGTGPLLPDQLARFESKLGEVVEFDGVVVSANASKSEKTRYLRFSQDWDKTILVFMMAKDVGDELTVDELNKKFANKKVHITGVVEKQFGSERIGVKIKAKDQIELIE